MNLASSVLWYHIVVICLCGKKQRNTLTCFRNVFPHSTGGPRKFYDLQFVHSTVTPSECPKTIPYVIP